jgi:AcrR family transcriptional regulator
VRRRLSTIDEIVVAAEKVMTAEGVAGLSLSQVAREIGLRQPSLYKYFPSRLAVYDEIFRRAAEEVLGTFRAATAHREPGWDTLVAGIEAFTRLLAERPVRQQLLFWRTVPGFQPSPAAYAPSVAFSQEVAGQASAAVEAGDLGPTAATDRGLALLSALIAGLGTQYLANEPDTSYEDSTFAGLLPDVLEMFRQAHRPEGRTP